MSKSKSMEQNATTIDPMDVVRFAFGMRSYVWPIAQTALDYGLGRTSAVEESWELETRLFHAGMSHALSRRPKPTGEAIDPTPIIKSIRDAAELGHAWVPGPKNGFTATVEIPQTERELGGVLKEFDNRDHVLMGEWTVHNDLMREEVKPTDRVVLYLHGGGFLFMTPASHRPLVINLSKAMGNCRILSVAYRLSPESQFPTAIYDSITALHYLLSLGPAENIYVAGDSAGGNLSLATLLYLRDEVRAGRMPGNIGGGILLSPWCDLTASLKSMESNVPTDYLPLGDKKNTSMNPPHLYLGREAHDTLVVHPYASPIIADLSSLPPLLFQAGGGEVLRDEIVLTAQRAASAGVQVELDVFMGTFHVFQAFIKTEASRAALRSINQWIERQPPPTAVDFSKIDNLLKTEFISRITSKKSLPPSAKPIPEPSFTPAYIFVSSPGAAAKIGLRECAHPVVRKVVEENEGVGERKEVTRIWTPEKRVVGKGRLSILGFNVL